MLIPHDGFSQPRIPPTTRPIIIRAVSEGRYPGKVVIFPQLSGLPLTAVTELESKYPDVARKLGPDHVWTREAEQALIERFLKDPKGFHNPSGLPQGEVSKS